MKKLIATSLVFVPAVFLTSCTVSEAAYTPGYTNDYVYSAGYYGYSPYVGYGYGYGWRRGGYWAGYRGLGYGYGYRGWNTGWRGGWHGGWRGGWRGGWHRR